MSLSALLRESTADLHADTDLLDRVRSGGETRLRRRRVGRVGMAVAGVVAVVIAAVVVLPDRGGKPDALVPAESTSDSAPAFGKAALEYWDEHQQKIDHDTGDTGLFDDVQGPARVLWSGATPVGPAAVLAQPVELHGNENRNPDNGGPHTIYGFFGPAKDGSPRLVEAVEQREPPRTEENETPWRAWWVDEAGTVMAVLLQGEDLAVSAGWTFSPDGRAQRTDWQPIRDAGGGVGFVQVEHSIATLVAKQPFSSWLDRRNVAGTGLLNASLQVRRLEWTGVRAVGGAQDRGDGALYALVSAALRSRTQTNAASEEGPGMWFVEGPGFAVTSFYLDGTTRPVAVLADGSVVAGEELDPTSPLPVHLRLPGGRGWVVAAYGKQLEWRHAGGSWTPAGADAALLPDGTDLEVKVGGTVVPLA